MLLNILPLRSLYPGIVNPGTVLVQPMPLPAPQKSHAQSKEIRQVDTAHSLDEVADIHHTFSRHLRQRKYEAAQNEEHHDRGVASDKEPERQELHDKGDISGMRHENPEDVPMVKDDCKGCQSSERV